MSLLQLVDVKPHLKIERDTDDLVLQGKLNSAEAYVSRGLDGDERGLSVVSVTETLRAYNGGLQVSKSPVVSITSITGEIFGAVSLSTLRRNDASGLVQVKAFQTPLLDDYYTVVYTTGYAAAADLPPDVVEAVRLMTQHFYDTQRGPNQRSTGGSAPGPDSAFARANQLLDQIHTGAMA